MLLQPTRGKLCTTPQNHAQDNTQVSSGPADICVNNGQDSQQEELLAKVTLELRAFRKAFSNKASTTICTAGGGLKDYPVVMMLLGVTTNSGQLIGTLIDLASDTNYITNNAAQRLGLIGESNQVNSPRNRWDEKDGYN